MISPVRRRHPLFPRCPLQGDAGGQQRPQDMIMRQASEQLPQDMQLGQQTGAGGSVVQATSASNYFASGALLHQNRRRRRDSRRRQPPRMLPWLSPLPSRPPAELLRRRRQSLRQAPEAGS